MVCGFAWVSCQEHHFVLFLGVRRCRVDFFFVFVRGAAWQVRTAVLCLSWDWCLMFFLNPGAKITIRRRRHCGPAPELTRQC